MISSAADGIPLTEPGRDHPFVHGPAGQGRILAVVGHRYAERPGVLQRGAHQMARDDRLAVVAHGDGPRPDQLTELGQLLSLLPEGDGPDRIDPRFAGALRLRLHEAHHTLVVAHRVGVGHGADRGEPAGRRRHGAGRDGLEIFLPRLAQVDVHVDQSRSHHLAAGIHHHGARRRAEVASDGLDLALEQVHVRGLVDLPRRIDHPAAPDQDPAQWSSPFPAALAQSGEPPARR
jgi:hypothetical protein